LDIRTTQRGPLAEKLEPPERRRQQVPAKMDRKPDERPKQTGDKERRSFRDRLREHWLVVTIAGCLVLIALVCGMVYWLEVRDYESTDDALVAARRSQIHAARIAARIMDLQWLGRAKGTVRSGSDARLRAFTTAFKEAALHLSGVRPNGKMMARHPLIVPGQEDDLLVAVPLPC
jgi:hypothetical protein